MARRIHLDRLHSLISIALASGGQRKSLMTTYWDISGDCTDPYRAEVHGRPRKRDEKFVIVGPGFETPQILEIDTRCRRCERCLRARSRRWYGAAVRETAYSARTWFGTLTVSPQNQFKFLSEARAKIAAQGIDYDTLDADDQFVLRHCAIGRELTRYIKRCRKSSGARLRYLLVAEKHKSGDPHYHMLVHESAEGGSIPHRILSEKWTVGFERWRLADTHDPRSAAYLCKYLSKSLAARVRASQGYGGVANDLHAFVCRELTKLERISTRTGGEPDGAEGGEIAPLLESLNLW